MKQNLKGIIVGIGKWILDSNDSPSIAQLNRMNLGKLLYLLDFSIFLWKLMKLLFLYKKIRGQQFNETIGQCDHMTHHVYYFP